MSLLADGKTERIDLGDGEWVEVLVTLPVKQACVIAEVTDKGLTAATLGILEAVITAWSEPIPLTPENIANIKASVAQTILTRFNEIAAISPKASSLPSTSTSKGRRRSRTRTS